MSFDKQLAILGTPRHIEGSPKVSVPHLRPRCTPSDAQHICMLAQCCPNVCGHLAWWLSEQCCQRLLLLSKQAAVSRAEVCKAREVKQDMVFILDIAQ